MKYMQTYNQENKSVCFYVQSQNLIKSLERSCIVAKLQSKLPFLSSSDLSSLVVFLLVFHKRSKRINSFKAFHSCLQFLSHLMVKCHLSHLQCNLSSSSSTTECLQSCSAQCTINCTTRHRHLMCLLPRSQQVQWQLHSRIKPWPLKHRHLTRSTVSSFFQHTWK